MGGVSRREILSIKPEILFLRAVCETSLKAFLTHSLASGVKGRTLVEGCQGAHSFNPAQIKEMWRSTLHVQQAYQAISRLTCQVGPLKRKILVKLCRRKETRMENNARTHGSSGGAAIIDRRRFLKQTALATAVVSVPYLAGKTVAFGKENTKGADAALDRAQGTRRHGRRAARRHRRRPAR